MGLYNKNGTCRRCGMFGDLCICDDLKKADKINRKIWKESHTGNNGNKTS